MTMETETLYPIFWGQLHALHMVLSMNLAMA